MKLKTCMRILNRIYRKNKKSVAFILLPALVTLEMSQFGVNQEVMARNSSQTENLNFKFSHYGEVTYKLNIRKEPSFEAEILDTISFYDRISYSEYNDEWIAIGYNNDTAYLCKEYVEELVISSVYTLSNDERKSYMDYRKITSKFSRQYQVQKKAYTSPDGYRMVENRYCIALGSYYSTSVGCYVDLILKNGVRIPCILADCKADKDTVDNRSKGKDGSVSEFVVNEDMIKEQDTKKTGNCSEITKGWDSPVVEIKIYENSIL